MKAVIFGVVVVAISWFGAYLVSRPATPKLTLGGIGSQLAEEYLPYVAINQGYYSNLPITTTGLLTASSSQLSAKKVCFQFYATSTATLLHMTASTTPTLPHGAAAVLTANYGSCN